MQVIEICGAREERFNISIPLDDPSSLETVAQVVDGVIDLLTRQGI